MTDETVGWTPNPNGRGTLSLVVSCVVTLTLCVWSALHLNIPTRPVSRSRQALEKTKWVLYGIFAPELVVATAAAQYITARWLRREIERDAQFHNLGRGKDDSSHTWLMAQCFYAVMGGFVTHVPWVGSDDSPGDKGEDGHRVAMTVYALRLLSFIGRLPEIPEILIQDKSKADWMAKAIVCVQALWMVAQVVGRLVQRMPISLLEINTCGHVACAMALYLFWWSKPLDVQSPTVLASDEDAVTLMFLCSQISARNDGICDIRCFAYFPYEKGPFLPVTVLEKPPHGDLHCTALLSLGSSGSRNLPVWHGFDGVSTKTATENNGYLYHHTLNGEVADECRPYLQDDAYNTRQFRHSAMYCRRVRLKGKSAVYVRLPPSILARVLPVIEKIWNAQHCRGLPNQLLVPSDMGLGPINRYSRLYFTHVSSQGAYCVFMGETDYLLPEMPNFPSLLNMSLGQVDTHRHLLPSIFAFTALAYGALHLAAWNGYFPSPIERVLWITAALWIAVSGGLAWTLVSAGFLLERLLGAGDGKVEYRNGRKAAWADRWRARALKGVVYSTGVVFAAARVFIVLEAIVSLREVDARMYDTPNWSVFIPHL